MKNLLWPIFLVFFLMSCSSDDSDPIIEEEVNLCVDTQPENFRLIEIGFNSAFVEWSFLSSDSSLGFEAEYGEQGFQQGTGTRVTNIDCICIELSGLSASTTYDLYVRAQCDDTSYSEYSIPFEFTTTTCPTPIPIFVIDITPNSARYVWEDLNDGGAYEVEYGEEGFVLGNGIIAQVNDNSYTMNGLEPATSYDVYVRSFCGNGYSEYAEKVTFTTEFNCNKPLSLQWTTIGFDYIDLFWQSNGESTWEIEYGLVGFELGTGTKAITSTKPYRIDGLQDNTAYQFYVRAICAEGGYSDRASIIVSTL